MVADQTFGFMVSDKTCFSLDASEFRWFPKWRGGEGRCTDGVLRRVIMYAV